MVTATKEPVRVAAEPKTETGELRTAVNALTRARRRLILKDSLAFLTLTAATVVLFAVTLFLFRSFTQHREDLAIRWSDRGRLAIQQGKPEQAIVALRTALSYAPGTRAYELLLAQALGEAGRTEESYNYFLGLWETEPGNGFTNLQLARLAAKKRERTAAVNFYRASIYGTWEGDGVARRAEVRMELANYLISTHDLAAARMELLIAGGNAPGNPDFDTALAQLLQEAGGTADAARYYQRSLAERPGDVRTLGLAGRLAFQTGDYATAYRLLDSLVKQMPPLKQADGPLESEDRTLLAQASRYLALDPAQSLPARQRVERVLAIRAIAKKRLDACNVPPGSAPQAVQAVAARWGDGSATADRRALLQDMSRQDDALQLAYATETATSQFCDAAPLSLDDMAVLLLVKAAPAGWLHAQEPETQKATMMSSPRRPS